MPIRRIRISGELFALIVQRAKTLGLSPGAYNERAALSKIFTAHGKGFTMPLLARSSASYLLRFIK